MSGTSSLLPLSSDSHSAELDELLANVPLPFPLQNATAFDAGDRLLALWLVDLRRFACNVFASADSISAAALLPPALPTAS